MWIGRSLVTSILPIAIKANVDLQGIERYAIEVWKIHQTVGIHSTEPNIHGFRRFGLAWRLILRAIPVGRLINL